MYRVLLVDDDAFVRQALILLLEGESDVEIVGEAANGRQAVQMARDLRPDVVLMDLRMPIMDGIEATRRIYRDRPETRVIALSTYDGIDGVRAMMEAGATKFLVKGEAPGSLLASIRNLGRR